MYNQANSRKPRLRYIGDELQPDGSYKPVYVEERRGQRPRVLTRQLSFRLPEDMYEMLRLIAEFEHIYRVSEMLRRMISQTIHRYERNPQFKRFLKYREKGGR